MGNKKVLKKQKVDKQIVAYFIDVISGREVTVISNGPVCYPSIYVPREVRG